MGMASELREGVPEREEGPLKAEGTGLLLPLLAPCPRCWGITRCCSLPRKGVPACWAAARAEEGLGLGACGTPCGVERSEAWAEEPPVGV